MDIELYGISAFAFWLTRRSRELRMPAGACDPLSLLAKPLHIAVPPVCRASQAGFVKHVRSAPALAEDIVAVPSGVRVPIPELCFVQIAEQLPFHQAVKAGCALCSTFALDPAQPFGLAERKPLTTRAKIASFVDSHPGLRGAKNARVAVGHIGESAASPAEIYQMMVLTLPPRWGGYGLRSLEANRVVRLGKKAAGIAGRAYVVPDLCDFEHRLAIEYDADATHAHGEQLSRDATKRMALGSMGLKVITVTTRQLASLDRMRDVAKEAARIMGTRVRTQSARFESEQRLLAATRKSFDGLFDREWLEQARMAGGRPERTGFAAACSTPAGVRSPINV